MFIVIQTNQHKVTLSHNILDKSQSRMTNLQNCRQPIIGLSSNAATKRKYRYGILLSALKIYFSNSYQLLRTVIISNKTAGINRWFLHKLRNNSNFTPSHCAYTAQRYVMFFRELSILLLGEQKKLQQLIFDNSRHSDNNHDACEAFK